MTSAIHYSSLVIWKGCAVFRADFSLSNERRQLGHKILITTVEWEKSESLFSLHMSISYITFSVSSVTPLRSFHFYFSPSSQRLVVMTLRSKRLSVWWGRALCKNEFGLQNKFSLSFSTIRLSLTKNSTISILSPWKNELQFAAILPRKKCLTSSSEDSLYAFRIVFLIARNIFGFRNPWNF